MKTYKNLWSEFISDENIKLAIKNAAKGKLSKRMKRKLKSIKANQEEWIPAIRNYAENFENAEHTPIEIYDGIKQKKRKIIVPNYMEQIVHHMVVNVLMPVFKKGMYAHSYGSIPKRGGTKAKKTLERWGMTKYVLKMDIRKYFDSIPQEILIAKLERVIKDKKMMDLLVKLIHVIPNGVPLGFYTSQWFANFYLQDLDHFVTEKVRAGKFLRYVDDMTIQSNNKRKLHIARVMISEYLRRLGLDMKENWQIFRSWYVRKGKEYGRALDFLGYKFYRNRTTLRRNIFFRTLRKAKRISKKKKVNWYEASQMLSYCGWFKRTNTHTVFDNSIASIINIKSLKKTISRHSKKVNAAAA